MDDKTITFSLNKEQELSTKKIILGVWKALEEKGYNPVNQLAGYILSEDPTYITAHSGARKSIVKLDRDELLKTLIRSYAGK